MIYLPGNRIAMIDFGMAGRLSPRRRNQIIDLLAGIARRDSEPMLDVLLDWAGERRGRRGRARRRCRRLVADYADCRSRTCGSARRCTVFTAICASTIVLPSDLTLMFKALITLEGSAANTIRSSGWSTGSSPSSTARSPRATPGASWGGAAARLGQFFGLLQLVRATSRGCCGMRAAAACASISI